MPDLKSVAEIITGTAAIVAAFKSWRAHNEAKEANATLAVVRTEISNILQIKQNTSVTNYIQIAESLTRAPVVAVTEPIIFGRARDEGSAAEDKTEPTE